MHTQQDRIRIEMLTAALDAAFGPAEGSTVEIARAPGRVNLIGDHMEYNEGFALPAAIDLETWLAFRRREDDVVRVVSRHSREGRSFRIDTVAPAATAPAATAPAATAPAATAPAATAPGASGMSGRWSEYVAGTAWSLREADIPTYGFDGVIDTTLPIGAGLASSAALELASSLALVGRARFLAPPSLAALAQRAERDYMGIDTGIIDQLASAAGRLDRAMLLDCRSLDFRYVSMPFGVSVVVCDTGEKREVRSSAYATRRAECARAVALLAEKIPGLCSLRDLDAASLRHYRTILPDNVAARAEHVVAENGRVLAAAAAMESGDLDELTRIFAESHASMRDLYGVSSGALDTMVKVARSIPGVIAARMTGLGFGGCTVNLVLADAVPALQAAVGREFDERTGLRGHVYPVAVVDGAAFLTPD